MTTVPIALGSLLSAVLGLYLLAVVSQWQSQSLLLLLSYYILSGLVAVLCMHGLVGLGRALVCWLITCS